MSENLIIDKLSIYSSLDRDSTITTYRINEELRNYTKSNFLNLDISIKYNRLWLILCPYKFLYQTNNNLYGVTFQEFKDIITNLNMILKDLEGFYNIKTEENLLNFNISGIDLTINILTDYFFSSYIPLFNSIIPKSNLDYSKYRDIRETKEDSCVYFMSKPRNNSSNNFTIRIYDKKEELNRRQVNIPTELEDKNIMRFELSFRNIKYIREKLGISKLIDIVSTGSFDYLEEKRIEILKDYLFHEVIDDGEHCLNSLNDIEIARMIKENKKRNYLLLIMLILSTDRINYRYLKDIFMTIDIGEAHINNVIKEIKEYKSLHRQSERTNQIPTISSLYEELFEKLFTPERAEIGIVNVA